LEWLAVTFEMLGVNHHFEHRILHTLGVFFAGKGVVNDIEKMIALFVKFFVSHAITFPEKVGGDAAGVQFAAPPPAARDW
jgi:hypothetical protein